MLTASGCPADVLPAVGSKFNQMSLQAFINNLEECEIGSLEVERGKGHQ
jgi:hypothetical protein